MGARHEASGQERADHRGNSGIGLATARLFVAEGARVAIIGRNKETLDAAAAELGGSVVPVQADVTDVEETERAVTTATERLGKLDVVFANAGAAGTSPLGQTSLAAFEQIVRINLTASFFTVQAALPHLNDGASIVHQTILRRSATHPRET
jgi:NAD(P)-dependent dehydrogenase (short-subunit alcohol dehydrogenase family)